MFNVASRGVGGSAAVDYGNQLRKIVTEVFCRKRIGEVWTRRRGFDIETTVVRSAEQLLLLLLHVS